MINNKIPPIGFGTWNRDNEETFAAVKEALTIGYRHIDTAQAYDNEAAVGQAIANCNIARSEIFLTTKVDPKNYGEHCVKPSVEQSLEKLQVESVDLLLLHFPSLYDEFEAEDYIQQIQQVKEAGLAKKIGVSNFTKHYLEIAFKTIGAENISMNQIEIHPYMQNNSIVNFCRRHNITTTAYSPLARGELINDPTLKTIAQKHNATTAQIALAFLLSQRHIIIPSSSNKKRAIENFNASKITLFKEDINLIQTLDKGMRLVNEPWCPKWDT